MVLYFRFPSINRRCSELLHEKRLGDLAPGRFSLWFENRLLLVCALEPGYNRSQMPFEIPTRETL